MRTTYISLIALLFVITTNAQDKKWSLIECIDYAIEHNISIKQQELTNEMLEVDITAAKGNFLPNLSGSASQNFNFGSYIDASNSGVRVSRNSNSNGFGINSGAVIYNGKRNKNLLLQAQKNLETAGFDLEENTNGIMLYVINAYLNAVLNKEGLIIAQDQVLIGQQQVQKANDLVDAGEQPKNTLLEAEATLATNEQQLTSAQNTLDLSLLSLAQLLQISHKGFDVEDVDLDINSASLIYNNTDDIYNTAVSSLPEIKSAELNVENAAIGVDIAKSGMIPSLTAGAGVSTNYYHVMGEKDEIITSTGRISNGFFKQLQDNIGYSVGISLNIPIFDRYQTKSSIARAEINKKRAELQLLDKKIKLRESIEKAYADAKASLNQFVSAEKSLSAQQESFKNAQESYNAGVMTSFDFNQVRNRLVNAQSSMVNAKYNFVFRTKLLEYYLGIPITF